MAVPPSPPPPELVGTLDYIVYALGAALTALVAWLGTHRKADPPVATLSGALMDNRAVDPLMLRLDALTVATKRLGDLLEQEVALRANSVEEAKRLEEQKRLAVAVADQVREDVLSELRNEFHKSEPAKMPTFRKHATDD